MYFGTETYTIYPLKLSIMSFFDLFKSQESRESLSHLKNLVAVAFADGRLEENEMAAIATVMSREGLSKSDFERCVKNPKGIKFIPPKTPEKRLQNLIDMVALMMCDGNIDEKEMLVCKITAEALGFKHEIIDTMIAEVIEGLKKKGEHFN